jgi:hypothetical protein
VREGAFRRVDPLLAARGFLGMVVYHFWIQEIFGGKRHQKFDPRQVCETLANIWLRGMQSSAATRNGKSPNGKRAHASRYEKVAEPVSPSRNGKHLNLGKRHD